MAERTKEEEGDKRGGQKRGEVGLNVVLIHQKSNLSLKVGGREGD